MGDFAPNPCICCFLSLLVSPKKFALAILILVWVYGFAGGAGMTALGELVGHRMMLRHIRHGLYGFKLCSGRCVRLAVFVDPDVPGILHD